MKTFLNTIPQSAYEREMINGNRYYKIGDAKYPSVTSILKILSEDSIQKWRERVGNEVADQISKKASERGTRLHSCCENYLLQGNPIIENEEDRPMFENCFLSELNKFDNIHCLEAPLYSHKYKYAGTVDCISEFNGVPSIIDFKTSAKPKKLEWIPSYFMQTTLYSIAFEEMTGIRIDNMVIIIGVDNLQHAQVFTQQRSDWEDKTIQLIKSYYNKLKDTNDQKDTHNH